MGTLYNRKVLFFCPDFRKYDEAIANKLRALGAEVIHFGTDPKGLIYETMMSSNQARNKFRRLLDKCRAKYFQNIWETIEGETFNFVFVIKGDTFPDWFLTKLKEANINAKFILYQWDSLKAYFYRSKSYFTNYKDIYDKIYSFDPCDCNNIKGIKYRPLFYLDIYANLKEEYSGKLDYDLYFTGSGQKDRVTILSQIADNSPDLRIIFNFHILFFSKYVKNIIIPKSGFKFYLGNISHHKIIEGMIRSKAVIDIPSSYQSGLTIRTFEVLSLGRKLITTNQNIRNEPFFSEKNILIIDKNTPEISRKFLEEPFVSIDMTNYSLESFLLEMLQN